MNTTRSRIRHLATYSIFAAAFVLSIPIQADPCGLIREGDNVIVGEHCARFLDNLEDISVTRSTPKFEMIFDLPDLIPVDVEVDVSPFAPNQIEIGIKTVNNGSRDAPDFEVTGYVVVHDLHATTVLGSQTKTVRLAGIAAGDDRRDQIGIFDLPSDDWTIVRVWLTVYTGGKNAWGEIYEGSELNNLLADQGCVIQYGNLDPCDV